MTNAHYTSPQVVKSIYVLKDPPGWKRSPPSADDLKDNFNRVTDPKRAEMLFQEAAAVSSGHEPLRNYWPGWFLHGRLLRRFLFPRKFQVC